MGNSQTTYNSYPQRNNSKMKIDRLQPKSTTMSAKSVQKQWCCHQQLGGCGTSFKSTKLLKTTKQSYCVTCPKCKLTYLINDDNNTITYDTVKFSVLDRYTISTSTSTSA